MNTSRTKPVDDLHDIINQKITALIREMEEADWKAEDVALAIKQVIDTQWLAKTDLLQDARNAVSKNFVSDGNEG